MNELTIINHGGVDVVESTLVAKAIEKRHDHLMRDIAGYINAITDNDALESTAPKFGVSDFFIPSEYQDTTGRTMAAINCPPQKERSLYGKQIDRV